MVIDGQLSMGHARALAATPDPVALATRAVAEGMSVRQVEAAARQLGKMTIKPASNRHVVTSRDANLVALEAQLADALGSRVTISAGEAEASGSVTLSYASLDQLDLICQRLTGGGRF